MGVCVWGGGGGTVIAHAHTNVSLHGYGDLAAIFHMGYGLPVIIRMTVLNYRYPFMVFYSVPITIIVNFNLTGLI